MLQKPQCVFSSGEKPIPSISISNRMFPRRSRFNLRYHQARELMWLQIHCAFLETSYYLCWYRDNYCGPAPKLCLELEHRLKPNIMSKRKNSLVWDVTLREKSVEVGDPPTAYMNRNALLLDFAIFLFSLDFPICRSCMHSWDTQCYLLDRAPTGLTDHVEPLADMKIPQITIALNSY